MVDPVVGGVIELSPPQNVDLQEESQVHRFRRLLVSAWSLDDSFGMLANRRAQKR
jgi:hypothetical protein